MIKGAQIERSDAEYQRKWREANPEKAREYRRKYYKANTEKEREYQRKWRETHREEGSSGRRLFVCECGMVGIAETKGRKYCTSCNRLRVAARAKKRVRKSRISSDELMQCYLDHPGTFHVFTPDRRK